MSFTDYRLKGGLVSLLLATLLLAGCAGTPKKSARTDVDNVNTVRSVRAQTAGAQAAASDSTHVTTVTATLEAQAAAQKAIGDYFAGVQMMKSGKFEDALLVFQQIAAEHPMLSGPLVNQGLILYRQEKWADANDAVDEALKVNDRNPFAWNLRGLIQREQGKFDEAKTSYQKALTIDENYAKAHFNLGILADMYLGDLKLALAHYEKYQSIQRKPDPAVNNWVADLRNRLGIVTPPPQPAAPPAASPASPAGEAAPASTTPAPAG